MTGDRNAGIRDGKGDRPLVIWGRGAIALSEKKGDRCWDSWMERSDRNAGIRDGKADRPFGQ